MSDLLDSDRCSRLLKALADPERLKIIQTLRDGPVCVSEVARQLHDEIANVSHHLRVLRNAGLLVDSRAGKNVFYSLHPNIYLPAKEAAGALDILELGCCRLELGGGKSKAKKA